MSKKLIAVSLFTEAGGMDVGFERPGIKVVFANEVMKEAAQTYILIDFRAFYGLVFTGFCNGSVRMDNTGTSPNNSSCS